MITPVANSPMLSALALDEALSSIVFMKEAAIYSLDSDPRALPDCLIQMALNNVFIPLSMQTTESLNRIKNNQDVKFKQIPYGSGSGKCF